MTCPKPPFVGTISACEDLTLQIARTLERLNPDHLHETWWTVEHVLTALINGGAIREEWGVRLTWDDTEKFEDHWGDNTRKFAEQRRDQHLRRRADTSTHGFVGDDLPAARWRVTPTLIRRFVITTAAAEVTE